MIVVDTNVIVHFALNGMLKEKTFKLLRANPNWAVPLLWRSEFRNVLALYLRKNLLSLNAALEIIDVVENELNLIEYSINSNQVLELVNKSKCSAYDCEFVVLAKQLKTKLVTEDKLIIKEFPRIASALRLV